jgi:hypothetical protein
VSKDESNSSFARLSGDLFQVSLQSLCPIRYRRPTGGLMAEGKREAAKARRPFAGENLPLGIHLYLEACVLVGAKKHVEQAEHTGVPPKKFAEVECRSLHLVTHRHRPGIVCTDHERDHIRAKGEQHPVELAENLRRVRTGKA